MIEATSSSQLGLSLISGLIGSVIGSIIGGLITFLVTRYSLQKTATITSDSIDKTTKSTRRLDREKEFRANEKVRKSAAEALLTETNENVESINAWNKKRRKFRFSTDAWTIYKQAVANFDSELQQLLIAIYAEISRHNTLIDYDLNLPVGSGGLDAEIERQINEINVLFAPLLNGLKKEASLTQSEVDI